MQALMRWCLFAEDRSLPGVPLERDHLFYGGLAVGAIFLAFVVVWLRRGRPRQTEGDRGLDEDLGQYPPPPGQSGKKRLLFDGRPVRLRLVVLAPAGRRALPENGAVEALLEHIVRGLGEVARLDKPRVRLWAPQLSSQGFAPTFFRHTRRPEPSGKPSRWLLAAGPARAGAQPVLLGLALLADEAEASEPLILEPTQWSEVLRVES